MQFKEHMPVIYIVMMVLLFIYLIRGGRRRSPSRFLFAKNKSSDHKRKVTVSSGNHLKMNKNSTLTTGLDCTKNNVEVSLNVIFMYNGEEWDAYEVLGVSAGCSLEKLENTFIETQKKYGEHKVPGIIIAAYKAALETHQTRTA